jgi:hypothetical protein
LQPAANERGTHCGEMPRAAAPLPGGEDRVRPEIHHDVSVDPFPLAALAVASGAVNFPA